MESADSEGEPSEEERDRCPQSTPWDRSHVHGHLVTLKSCLHTSLMEEGPLAEGEDHQVGQMHSRGDLYLNSFSFFKKTKNTTEPDLPKEEDKAVELNN